MSLVLGVLLATAAIADAGALGRLEGLARDENGNVLPGVTVGVHSVSGTLDRAATTDARGAYRMENLAPAYYRIDFKGPAASPFVDRSMAIGPARETEIKMSVGLERTP